MSLTFLYPYYLWLLVLVPITLGIALVGRRAENRYRLWGGMILRAILLTALILALAGIQIRLPSDRLTTVFVLDVSESIPPAERERGEEIIGDAIGKAQPGGIDRAAVVVFGEEALVDQTLDSIQGENSLLEINSIPTATSTNIADALQLAQALLPGEGSRRIVLLSDGRENLGQAVEQARIIAEAYTGGNDQHAIDLLYVPLGAPPGEYEVRIDELAAPPEVRQGESFELSATIAYTTTAGSAAPLAATLRIFENNTLIDSQELELLPGRATISVPVKAQRDQADKAASSFRRFRAQIEPQADTRLENNSASAFTIVHGPPNILIVEGQPGDGENLARALQAAEMSLTRIAPSQMPTTLPELANYQAVIIVNTNAKALPEGTQEILQTYVRDLGMGLAMIGGPDSFGAGGYLRSPLEQTLPVDMDVRDKDMQANLALVLAVDKSGSMGRCHCDNPDLNQTYTRAEVGQPKVDIAKEAVMRAASALGMQDYLGVLAFDSQPHWVLKLDRLVDPAALENSISTFQAEGQTNLQAGVKAAYAALQDVPARRKHIILMTDGWVRTGELTTLAQEMNEQGITLSVVAAGQGSAEYLAAVSQLGGGTYYPATDVFSVPDIFLKETVKSAGKYVVEEPFYPLPATPGEILRGLDTTRLPPLLGYNGASPKNTARLDLITPRGDPLLATWQYGLGRAAAWTSDLKNQWAADWLQWSDFSKFAAQLVGWLPPAPKVEGLEAEAHIEEGQAIIRLQAVDQQGQPLNFLSGSARLIAPDLQTAEIPLKQIGAGQYQAASRLDQPGAYLVRLGVNQGDQSLGQLTLGIVVPYSPEYKETGADPSMLQSIAQVFGRPQGSGQLSDPAAAFLHNISSAPSVSEIWQGLLVFVALLFPVDVALRRLRLGRQDFYKALAYLTGQAQRIRQALRPSARSQAGQPQILGQLFQARDRARQRQDAAARPPVQPADSTVPGPEMAINQPDDLPEEPAVPPSRPSPESPTPGDALERLRAAKKRARR